MSKQPSDYLQPGDKYLEATDRNGNRYKVLNPEHFRVFKGRDGRFWVRRPKPEFLGTAEESNRPSGRQI